MHKLSISLCVASKTSHIEFGSEFRSRFINVLASGCQDMSWDISLRY